MNATNIRKKISTFQKVDIDAEIDGIQPGPLTGKESWTKNAKILVYEGVPEKRSPHLVVSTLIRQEANKYYRLAEKTSAKMMDAKGRSKIARRVQMLSFFFLLDMMLIEVQNTIMHSLLNK